MAQRALAGAKKGAKRERRTIVFIDESGFYLLPALVRTWAKRGQTPLVAHQLTRDHLSVICALVHNGKRKGRLLMQVRDRAFCGQSVIGFLLHLLGQLKGKLLVIWDGASIHRSKAVQAFLASPVARRLRVERLPGYAPELNPVEAVWQYLKRVELRNLCCDDLVHLRAEIRKALARLRYKTKILLGCLRKPRLL